MEKRTYPEFNQAIKEKLNSVISFARNNEESNFYKDLPTNPLDSLPDFQKIAVISNKNLQIYNGPLRHYPETAVRYLVSIFEPDEIDALFLFPQHANEIWHSLDEEIKKLNPEFLISILPSFWQLAPLFYKTVQDNKIPAIVLPPRNLPLARQVIKEVGVRGVITTPNSTSDLNMLLREANLEKQVFFWHLVLPLKGNSGFNPGIESVVFLEK